MKRNGASDRIWPSVSTAATDGVRRPALPLPTKERPINPTRRKPDGKPFVDIQLQEWIDGNIIYSSGWNDGNIGFIETYFQTCMRVFRRIWSCIVQNRDILRREQFNALRQSLSRLVLWIDAFEPGELDQLLNRFDDLKETVLELVTEISKTLLESMRLHKFI
jgi:hypothetical protein